MMPNLGPERLPNIDSAADGRFARKGKKVDAKETANPDSLLDAGVYIPDTSEE